MTSPIENFELTSRGTASLTRTIAPASRGSQRSLLIGYAGSPGIPTAGPVPGGKPEYWVVSQSAFPLATQIGPRASGRVGMHWGSLSGESRNQAGTYVSRTTLSPIGSLESRRSGGRGPAKNGLPLPSTTGLR
jgi:hypothetical protein